MMSVLRNFVRDILRRRRLPQRLLSAEKCIAVGWTALEQGRLEDAEKTADAVLTDAPLDGRIEGDAYLLRGQARTKKGDYHGALRDYECALNIAPDSITILLHQGAVLHALDRFEDALSVADAILSINYQHALAHNNRGLMLRELARVDDAEDALRRALQCDQACHEARVNLALALIEQGRLEEAEAELAQVLDVDPGQVDARWNRAIVCLLQGRYSEGWRDYESRLDRGEHRGRPHKYPRWDGRVIDHGVLLIHGEQGLGDDILFASCFEDAMARTSHCAIECEPRLERLFARSFPRARVVGSKFQPAPRWVEEEIQVTAQVPAGSLPGLFRNRKEDFPEHRGYLTADPLGIEAWRARLDALGNELKVGIAWTGGTPKTRRATRSLPLLEWLPILENDAAHFISLQYVDSSEEITDAARSAGIRVHAWPELAADYDETAALVMALDLVISVTTSIVHLAGALGQHVWVMVPAHPEWRYLQQGPRMPWYPSARLFRQTRRGDWSDVIHEIANRLQYVVASGKPAALSGEGFTEWDEARETGC